MARAGSSGAGEASGDGAVALSRLTVGEAARLAGRLAQAVRAGDGARLGGRLAAIRSSEGELARRLPWGLGVGAWNSTQGGRGQ